MAITLTAQQTFTDVTGLNSYIYNNADIIGVPKNTQNVTYAVVIRGNPQTVINVTQATWNTVSAAWTTYQTALATLSAQQSAAALAAAGSSVSLTPITMTGGTTSPSSVGVGALCVLVLTGVLASGGTLQLPAGIAAGTVFAILNLTTGLFAVTVLGPSDAGSGIAVGTSASNDAALLIWTGTKIQRLTANTVSTS